MMKTFQQFCEDAYQLNEFNVRGALTTAAKTILNPKELFKSGAKSAVAQIAKEPLKRATGNNPIINKAIDVGANWVAPAVRWGPAARSAARALPHAAAVYYGLGADRPAGPRVLGPKGEEMYTVYKNGKPVRQELW